MHEEKPQIKQVIGKLKRISSLPLVFARINELLSDPKSCSADIGKVISKDQALTARLLRMVNSAFYGFPQKIDTVSRAVTIIGFRQLRELVLATSVVDLFKGLGDRVSLRMEDFWKHSLACAVACRILAIYRREQNHESYFVAGLLHDIGRLVLIETLPAEYGRAMELSKSRQIPLAEAELEIFGFDHAAVGRELIRHWRLAHELADAVGFHETFKNGSKQSVLGDGVHLANIFTHASEIGFSGEIYIPPLNPTAFERLGFQKTMIESVIAKVHEQFEDARSMLMTHEAGAV